MTAENNWIVSNIQERLSNKICDFNISINIDKYEKLSFEDASTGVCNKLASISNNIYISLSGGVDSEYVFKKFYSLNIPFTPVIVKSSCYEEETLLAINLCNSYNINPVVIEVTEDEIFNIFYKKIHKDLNGYGIFRVPALLVAEYASNNNGICVYGEHLLGKLRNNIIIEINEWDFYPSTYYNNTYNFFIYTPEIVYSLLNSINPNEDYQTFKCRLFNIIYRDKIKPKVSDYILNYYRVLKNNNNNKPETTWRSDVNYFLANFFK